MGASQKVERSNTGQKMDRHEGSQGHYYRNYSNSRNDKAKSNNDGRNTPTVLSGKANTLQDDE